jgi:hypothetical protein
MDIITFIKFGRLKWAGHFFRIDKQRPAKIILNAKPEGRKKTRPKLRWEDGVGNYVKVLGERRGKNRARNVLRKVMAQKDCFADDDDDETNMVGTRTSLVWAILTTLNKGS